MEGFSVIMPLVLLMASGAALRYVKFFNDSDVACMSKLIYWLICPAMLFNFAMKMDLDWAANLTLAKGIYLAVLSTVAGVYLIGRYLLKIPWDILPISVSCSFRSNSMLIGLPVAALVLGEAVFPLAAVYFAVTEVGYNLITSLTAELLAARGGGGGLIRKSLLGAARNPLVIGSVLGLLFSSLGLHSMPEQVDKVFQIITNMSVGVSVLMIGASLKLKKGVQNVKALVFDVFVRFGLFPAAMFLALSAFKADETMKQVIVIISAAPSGNITFILANELGLNSRQSAEFIAASTLFFVLATPFWLNVLGLV